MIILSRMRFCVHLCSSVVPLILFALLSPDPAEVARAIREEATRPNRGPAGRPLPLAAHWNMGSFGPEYQIQKIEAGNYLLPWFAMPDPRSSATPENLAYYEAAFQRAARLRLPLALVGTQWESLMYWQDYLFSSLPEQQNPNVTLADGSLQKQLDPFGPLRPWQQTGQLWGSSPILRRLQQWYPDPPLVVFLSNNEATKLPWHQVELSLRYLQAHGRGREDAYKREVVGRAWIEKYRAMQDALRRGLVSDSWRRNAIFVGYDAFGPPHFARWNGWMEYALLLRQAVDPAARAWDGGSPSFYLHNWNDTTDYAVWSPQGEAMNWVFMLQETLRLNPRFWFEISTWDGEEEKRKKLSDVEPFTEARYGGMVQFGMWLLRPRVVREFRNWRDTVDHAGSWFEPILAAVNRVHREETLQRFWRRGELVANRARLHPYQADVPPRYAKEDRWFLLDSTADPPRPFTATTRLAVFALALVLGEKPQREWLVYAHAPLGDRRQVGLVIPDFQTVTVDVPVAGAFYRVLEKPGAPPVVSRL